MIARELRHRLRTMPCRRGPRSHPASPPGLIIGRHAHAEADDVMTPRKLCQQREIRRRLEPERRDAIRPGKRQRRSADGWRGGRRSSSIATAALLLLLADIDLDIDREGGPDFPGRAHRARRAATAGRANGWSRTAAPPPSALFDCSRPIPCRRTSGWRSSSGGHLASGFLDAASRRSRAGPAQSAARSLRAARPCSRR